MERRKYPRTRVIKGTKIVLGATLVLDCVVRDLRNGGARVKIPNAVRLTSRKMLPSRSMVGAHADRAMLWGVDETGLDFIDPLHQLPPKR